MHVLAHQICRRPLIGHWGAQTPLRFQRRDRGALQSLSAMHCKRVQCRPRADYRATSAPPKNKRQVTLLDSLFDAIIRLDGDALVMHVGEKPYVVLSSATVSALRGPLAWG